MAIGVMFGKLCRPLLCASGMAALMLGSTGVAAQTGSAYVQQVPTGLYLKGFGGVALGNDQDVDLTTLPPALTFPFKAGTDTGFAGGGAIGVQVPCWGGLVCRPEFEITYSNQDFDSYRSNSGNFVGTGVGGSLNITTYMANVTVGAPIASPQGDWLFGKVIPYVGGGIGVANVDADLSTTNGNLLPPILLAGQQFSGSDTAFAFNLKAGVEWCVDVGSVCPYVEYRYTSIQDVSLGTSQPLLAPNVDMDDISSSAFMFGINIRLDSAACELYADYPGCP